MWLRQVSDMETGIVLGTHGNLAEGLVSAVDMIAGAGGAIKTFSLAPGMDPFEYRAGVEAYLDEHADEAHLCFVDLFGGTPSNMLASLSQRENVEVVAGVSLPSVIEVSTRKDQMSLAELRDTALEAIHAGAVDVKGRFSEMLKKRQEG